MTAIEILRNEHCVIRDCIALIEHHAGSVGAGAPLDGEFARWAVQFLEEFVEGTHLAKEEGVLFTLLARHGLAPDAPPLAAVAAAHRAHRRRVPALDDALGRRDGPAWAAAAMALAGLLRAQLRAEEETLFTLAERVLTPADDADAVQGFGRVVQEQEGVLVRQRHLAAIERWRGALCRGPSPGA